MEETRKTIAQTILSQKTDWRFPDGEGLSQRTLDCRQLCMMEVLKWKGERQLTPVFLNAFDCESNGLMLRRSEPEPGRGWRLTKYSPLNTEGLYPLIDSVFDHEGYCLLFYNAKEAVFSSYHGKHDIVHWSLLVDYDEAGVTLVDDEGAPAFFNGYIGKVPWQTLMSAHASSEKGGVAILGRRPGYAKTWEEEFLSLVRASVHNMVDQQGLKNLENFVKAVAESRAEALIPMLETLEFDVHYFRRLRELWKAAVENGTVPDRYKAPGWVEELVYVCKLWSLVMGVLAKWKRQPDKDYSAKLTDYLGQALESEKGFYRELRHLV
ncbi:hypothetical protein PC41400_06560 [Paenibacillus chitinolyticus]|uniref:Butirosin biosynthesis protein H N-terminal domain-containing protein n=1 Tax=Paenibacillus chitinolyticus TaxID=79263 RepID=A0A410WSP7_9BACL|nr:hypothetical protein [Paenibacillus chitinolyticus]MCY9591238.1 hypothetical protein [Paenibacillus chitinolyticus]MCY9595579.1 hypothetical protein [Paenibacillus chitinolyticus]QAV17341.1 hypothetical protein PC41400_06560 [Paenibacillus chitinolyticus]